MNWAQMQAQAIYQGQRENRQEGLAGFDLACLLCLVAINNEYDDAAPPTCAELCRLVEKSMADLLEEYMTESCTDKGTRDWLRAKVGELRENFDMDDVTNMYLRVVKPDGGALK